MYEFAPIPNEGKNLTITTDRGIFARYPIRTHVVRCGEDLHGIMREYVLGKTQPDDLLFISEKIIAICQNRAFDIDDIHPSQLANLLCRFVYKSPYGIGLGSPWTMELALRDVGLPRMLLAAGCSAVTKPFGVRGVFYRVAGTKARAIDGPCDCTIPPYNHFAKLAPAKPDKVAAELATLRQSRTTLRRTLRRLSAAAWSSLMRTTSASMCSAAAAKRSPKNSASRCSATIHSDRGIRARRCAW